MQYQIFVLWKRRTTPRFRTLKGFFPRVCSHVHIQVNPLGKLFATAEALERLFTCVCADVCVQGRLESKRLPTTRLWTLVRPLPCVGSHVHFEIPRFDERLVAAWFRTVEGFLTRVDLHVSLEVRGASEGFVTVELWTEQGHGRQHTGMAVDVLLKFSSLRAKVWRLQHTVIDVRAHVIPQVAGLNKWAITTRCQAPVRFIPRVRAHVNSQRGRTSEGAPATRFFAMEGFLPAVGSGVVLQRWEMDEGFPTVRFRAPVRPLACVCAYVLSQISCQHKSMATVMALEWFLISMDLLVSAQCVGASEWLATVGLRTVVRLFTRMRPHVLFQVDLLHERLPAWVALERLFPRVRPAMHSNSTGGGKTFAAAWFGTLIRFLACVNSHVGLENVRPCKSFPASRVRTRHCLDPWWSFPLQPEGGAAGVPLLPTSYGRHHLSGGRVFLRQFLSFCLSLLFLFFLLFWWMPVQIFCCVWLIAGLLFDWIDSWFSFRLHRGSVRYSCAGVRQSSPRSCPWRKGSHCGFLGGFPSGTFTQTIHMLVSLVSHHSLDGKIECKRQKTR